MTVKLISYTKPADFFTVPTSKHDVENVQDLVAYCARVSNPSNQNNKETNEKLGLNYSATLVELMQKFNKEHSKKVKDGSNK